MNLEESYLEFLKEKVDDIYLSKIENIQVLGANIVKNVYFTICETSTEPKKHYIFVLDGKKNFRFEIETMQKTDGYIVVYKKHLRSVLGKKYYKIFVERGLARTEETGWNLENYCCWHRLVLALYTSMLDRDTHHLNRNNTESNIINIVPILTKFHEDLHNYCDVDEYHEKLLMDFIYSLKHSKKRKHQTVASNEELQLQILTLKTSGKSVKEILKLIKYKISERSIYNISEKFSIFPNEFIKWLETKRAETISLLDAKNKTRWGKIIEFERLLDNCA